MNDPLVETPPPSPGSGLPPTGNADDSARNLTWVIYGLYAGGFVAGGLTTVAGLIVAYVKRESVAGTWLASHFTWLIRTFWISLAVGLASLILMILGVGVILMMANLVWVIYRLVVGGLALNDRKPIVEGKWGLAA